MMTKKDTAMLDRRIPAAWNWPHAGDGVAVACRPLPLDWVGKRAVCLHCATRFPLQGDGVAVWAGGILIGFVHPVWQADMCRWAATEETR